jgi:hypothetical protein
MKSIFEPATRDELKTRIQSLGENSTPLWGKMTVSQMMQHCAKWDEMALEKTKYKHSFIGRLFGRIALKKMMTDKPMKKNMPTVPSFKIKEDSDVTAEKQNWLRLIDEYAHYTGRGHLHPFFGTMTKEQTGIMMYKHVDHHLRQFNA